MESVHGSTSTSQPWARPALGVLWIAAEEPPRDGWMAALENTPLGPVRTARTPKEALAALAERSFDALVLDLAGFGPRALETVESLVLAAPRAPLLVLTQGGDETLAAGSLLAGAQDSLGKADLSPEVLRRAIHHAIQRHRSKAELERISSELRAANGRLEQLALLDPLTEVWNRRGLNRILQEACAARAGQPADWLAFLIDLDDFKRINDRLGHAVGDVVLQSAAAALRQSLRPTDHVGRVGGDEFLVVLPHTAMATGLKVAETVRRAVARSLVALGERSVGVTASVAVVPVQPGRVSIDGLLAQCHMELRNAKRAGKNRVHATGVPLAEVDSPHRRLEAAWREGAFATLAQPLVRLADRVTVGQEYLSRGLWTDLEAPADFFRLSYESNLLTLVDHGRFQAAAARAAELPPGHAAHLNLFPSTLLDVPAGALLAALPVGFDPRRLCVEISEQQILGDPHVLLEPVRALRAGGARVAMDDVGFGRSSLESLLLLAPEVVKLDRRQVHGASENREQRQVLRRLIRLCQALGATPIAEGVETEADAAMLLELGVEYAQGYLLGRPS